MKVIAEFCRVLIGAVFVFSGIVKSIDPVGSAIKIGEYMDSFGLAHFSWMDMMLSFGLSSIEFALGACLLLAVCRKWVTLGVLIFMSIMTPLTLYIWLYNPVADCGCFGDALIIPNWLTFFKNVVLLAAAIIVFVFRKRLAQFFTHSTQWIVLVFTFFFCTGFCYWNYAHLPVTDFLPYKVGENIPAMMAIPDDAPQDEYRFIYEKNGVRKEFTLEEAPASDSTWTYVDSKLVRQGFTPKVETFELYDKNNENVAEAILHQPEAVLLLIAPRIEEASEKHAAQINNIYDFTCENDEFTFYCVTSSSDDKIDGWKKDTHADYPYLMADDVVLKMMIRSNPGLMLLKEGTILGKWHHNDLPTTTDIIRIVSEYQQYTTRSDDASDPSLTTFMQKDNFWLYIISAFILPLLLVWLYDFIKNRKFGKIRIVDKH